MSQSKNRGFSLIEIIVVIVIIAITAAIAIPNYRDAVLKANRADAIAALLDVQQAQMRYRANNNTYVTAMSNLEGYTVDANVPSGNGDYLVTVTSSDAAGFAVRAVAQGTQANDADCATMVLCYYREADALCDAGYNKTPEGCWD